jgi:hypothetical protein
MSPLDKAVGWLRIIKKLWRAAGGNEWVFIKGLGLDR